MNKITNELLLYQLILHNYTSSKLKPKG